MQSIAQQLADALNADGGAIARLFGRLGAGNVYCLVFENDADALRAARGEAPLVAPRRRQAPKVVVAAQGGGMGQRAAALLPHQALVGLCRGSGDGFVPLIYTEVNMVLVDYCEAPQ